jgi:hypothetical protein
MRLDTGGTGMSARAVVENDFARDGVAIHLGRKVNGETQLVMPLPDIEIDTRPPGVYAVSEPALRLPDDMARALLDALAAHYGGQTDTRTLRQDYLAERARVDRLLTQMHDMTVAFGRYIYDHPPG